MLERLLVVGLGSIGRRHARLARELMPGVRIAALRRVAGGAGDPAVDVHVHSLEHALAFRPQAAVIANPASHHLEMAIALARAGVHLLVEKPIAATAHGVGELITECRVRGLVLMTGYNLRFLSSLERFRELLGHGSVGRVLSIRAEVGQFLPSWRPEADYRQTVSARAELGGGVLLELSHEIDYLRWLFGEVQWVWAFLGRRSGLEIDVEETVHLALAFADQGTPLVAALSLDFVRHDRSRRCTVIGETGTLRWDAITGTVELFERGADGWRSLFAQAPRVDDSYRDEWRDFLHCMATGNKPLVTGEDGLAVLRIVEAARASARCGAIVPLSAAIPPGRSGATVS
jgi:predicted dehydrogenase